MDETTSRHQPDTRTLGEYLDTLKSGAATPGGGSASAYTGAMGAALLAMVCRLSLKSESNSELDQIAAELDGLVDELSRLAREDEQAFGRYRNATKLPKATDEEKSDRRDALQAALLVSAETPLSTARLAARALSLADSVASHGSRHTLSDVDTAVALLQAASAGALFSVRVNLAMLSDAEDVRRLSQHAVDIEAEQVVSVRNVERALQARADAVD